MAPANSARLSLQEEATREKLLHPREPEAPREEANEGLRRAARAIAARSSRVSNGVLSRRME